MWSSPLTYILLTVGAIFLTYQMFQLPKKHVGSDFDYEFTRYYSTFGLAVLLLPIGILGIVVTVFGKETDVYFPYIAWVIAIILVTLGMLSWKSEGFQRGFWTVFWKKDVNLDKRLLTSYLFAAAFVFAFLGYVFHPYFAGIPN